MRSIATRKSRKNSTYFFTAGFSFSTRSSAACRERKSRSALIAAIRLVSCADSVARQVAIFFCAAEIVASRPGRSRFSAVAAAAARRRSRLQYGPQPVLCVSEQFVAPISQPARNLAFVTRFCRAASLLSAAVISFCAPAIFAW